MAPTDKKADIEPAPEAGRQADPDGASSGTASSREPVRKRDTDEIPEEIGGRSGPDPARYGDWEKNGRCIDF